MDYTQTTPDKEQKELRAFYILRINELMRNRYVIINETMNNYSNKCKQKGNTGNDDKQTKRPWKWNRKHELRDMNLSKETPCSDFPHIPFLIISLNPALKESQQYDSYSTRNYSSIPAACTLSVPAHQESLACHSH